MQSSLNHTLGLQEVKEQTKKITQTKSQWQWMKKFSELKKDMKEKQQN